MDIRNIIEQIDAQISQLSQARALLSGSATNRKPGRPRSGAPVSAATSFNPAEFDKTVRKRTMSPETRDKMAAAQRLRWANVKKTEKKAVRQPAPAITGRIAKRASKKKPGSTITPTAAKTVAPRAEQNETPTV